MAQLTTTEWHTTVLGREPTAEQSRLYSNYPAYRGISNGTRDLEIADAIVVLALRSGIGSDRVLVLVPQAHEAWFLEHLETTALNTFEGCRRWPKRASELIYGYTRLFQKLTMTGRPLQLREEPQYWVSFGFTLEDILPPWMPNRLLPQTQGGQSGRIDVPSP